MNNIDVKPSDRPSKVAVATDEIGGIHTPIYKVSYGDLGTQTPVSEDNPLPVINNTDDLLDSQLISSRELKDELVELNVQMKILNKYMSKWHGDEITEEDLENDHNY